MFVCVCVSVHNIVCVYAVCGEGQERERKKEVNICVYIVAA